MTDGPPVRAHVFVAGRVQGVFFRHETRERAQREGVAGWVRNTEDGRVEAVFEGSPDAVERLVTWCHEGTRYAEVSRVDVEREPPEGLDRFEVRP